MKTLVRQVGIAAALAMGTPLFTLGQAGLGSSPGRQNIERLTLLPGPYLLSPARTTPTMAPAPLKLGAGPAFYHVPLAGNESTSAAENRRTPPATTRSRPTPESLRFDWKLNAPPAPGEMQFVPAVKSGWFLGG